jgi:hypothetical protein
MKVMNTAGNSSGKKTLSPGEQIDHVLQKMIEKFLPKNVDAVLFRSRVESMVVAISSESPQCFYSFNAHYADFVAA